MKSKVSKILIFALMAILVFGTVGSSAYNSYMTYTFSEQKEIVESPTAFYPYDVVTALEMGMNAQSLIADMVTDENGYIYISDGGNKEILVFDESYTKLATIKTFRDKYGDTRTFDNPQGIFVSKTNESGESFIYVCDYGKEGTLGRVFIFDKDFNYYNTIEEPESKVIDEGSFKPQAIAVDQYGRMFITSSQSNAGIFVLSPEGEFNGFIGGQKNTASFFDRILNKFKDPKDRMRDLEKENPRYNNITIDEDGFVYATISFQGQEKNSGTLLTQQYTAITSKSADYSPVKKFNSKGAQIMVRNGFFDPSGEATVLNNDELSEIIDIAVGAEGAWTIFDVTRSRTYTYDQQGNLLYAFGDQGDQLGQLDPKGDNKKHMCYQTVKDPDTGELEYRLLIIEKNTRNGITINIYTPTRYADAITNALKNENNHNYSEAADAWQDVLTENNNLDLAYIGMGKAYYFQGEYEKAMEALKSAYDTKYYSMAYSESRNDVVSKWLIPLLAAAIVLIVLIIKFLGYAKRKNKATSLKVGKKTYWEELIFVFHLVFHPFDGFWDLKHEKRGSVRAASTILALTIIAFFYNDIGRGYMFNPRPGTGTIFTQLISIGLPVVLWVVSNWCLTTLFEGEGSIKDIYIATCYSLAPLPIFVTVSTILSNLLTASEATIVNMLIVVAAVWMIILLFFGMVVTHDYTIGKNVITTLATLLAAVVIIFIFVLFASLVAKMGTLVSSLYNEIANRI